MRVEAVFLKAYLTLAYYKFVDYVLTFLRLRNQLLGCVALVRGVAGYSHQTFPWTICRSVGLYMRLSVHCIVEKRRIRPGCRLAS